MYGSTIYSRRSPIALRRRDGAVSVAVAPEGGFVYVVNADSNNVSGYTINPTTGALTAISGSPFAAGSRPFSVGAFHLKEK